MGGGSWDVGESKDSWLGDPREGAILGWVQRDRRGQHVCGHLGTQCACRKPVGLGR